MKINVFAAFLKDWAPQQYLENNYSPAAAAAQAPAGVVAAAAVVITPTTRSIVLVLSWLNIGIILVLH